MRRFLKAPLTLGTEPSLFNGWPGFVEVICPWVQLYHGTDIEETFFGLSIMNNLSILEKVPQFSFFSPLPPFCRRTFFTLPIVLPLHPVVDILRTMDLSEFGDAAAFLRRNTDDPLLQPPAFDGTTLWKLLAWVHIITLRWYNYLLDYNEPSVLKTNLFEWCASRCYKSLNNWRQQSVQARNRNSQGKRGWLGGIPVLYPIYEALRLVFSSRSCHRSSLSSKPLNCQQKHILAERGLWLGQTVGCIPGRRKEQCWKVGKLGVCSWELVSDCLQTVLLLESSPLAYFSTVCQAN